MVYRGMTPVHTRERTLTKWEREWLSQMADVLYASVVDFCTERALAIFKQRLAGKTHKEIASNFDVATETARSNYEKVLFRIEHYSKVTITHPSKQKRRIP